MSWITPTTTWSDSDTPTPSDFNRIEGNTDYLKTEAESNDSDILSNASSISSVESGLATEVSTRAAADTTLDGRVTTIEGSGSIQGVGTSNSVSFHDVDSSGNVYATEYVSTAGYVRASGKIYSTTGDIEADNGDVIATLGDIKAHNGAIGGGSLYTVGGPLSMNGPIVPYQTSSGSWSIPTTGYVPSAGVYMVSEDPNVLLQIYVAGSWRAMNSGTFVTYGGNVRLINSGTGTKTVYYQKY